MSFRTLPPRTPPFFPIFPISSATQAYKEQHARAVHQHHVIRTDFFNALRASPEPKSRPRYLPPSPLNPSPLSITTTSYPASPASSDSTTPPLPSDALSEPSRISHPQKSELELELDFVRQITAALTPTVNLPNLHNLPIPQHLMTHWENLTVYTALYNIAEKHLLSFSSWDDSSVEFTPQIFLTELSSLEEGLQGLLPKRHLA